jgi:predicted ester cyclase
MTPESYKSAIRDFFAAIDRAQNLSPLDAFAAPSFKGYFPGAPGMNHDGTKAYANAFYAACPGLRHSVEDVIVDGDAAAVRLTVRGTHTKPFMTPSGTIPPQGRAFELSSINVYRFANGKAVEQHTAFDMLGFLQQIGAMPGPQ